MIVKYREQSPEFIQLEAMERRLPPSHHKKELIQEEIIRRKRGIRGEKEIAYPLSFLDDQHRILHYVRLQDQNGFFQMDTLVLCKSHILILEVKNWYGSIFF